MSLLFLTALSIFLLRADFATSAKILMNGMLGEGSHFFCMASIGEALVHRNHSVTMLISNAYKHRAIDPRYSQLFKFEVFNHSVPIEEIHEQFDAFNRRAFSGSTAQMLSFIEVLRDGRSKDCDAILSNQGYINQLRNEKFDLLVYDLTWYCGPLIGRSLGIPYVATKAVALPCNNGNLFYRDGSFNPAYIPEVTTGFTNRMTFAQRVQNFIQNVMMEFVLQTFRKTYDALIIKHKIGSESIGDLFRKNELLLINGDFAVEFPCHVSPNVVLVGGLTTRPSNPLPPELEDFMESSGEHGVVICTSGTYYTDVPSRIINAYSKAFARLPQKVVWQLKATLQQTPSNVKVMPWIPQNDLLGHPKTRVLMFQGGNNGIYEAIYHQVPVITIPIHGDQYDNGARVTTRGIGRNIDKGSISGDVLYEALYDVINNDSYRDAMRRVSAIFKDRPQKPTERAAYWIEHVLKHGGKYMISSASDLTIIQRNLIDVGLFLIAVLVILIGLCYYLIRSIIRCICFHDKVEKKPKAQ